ncbi:type II secretion system protein [Candidatus Parcubacteria bacterium]|nr:type II secretion system protein [Candidatus Parcubacteria bacterium]
MSILKNRGFTLIELLVVIAIIGILASVVLASLNSARDKGADAAIKSSVNNARAQAELYYSNNNNYTAVCTGTGGVAPMVTGATNAGGTNVECTNSATAWGLNAQLKSTGAGFYCVDSTGAATTTATDTISGSTDYTC